MTTDLTVRPIADIAAASTQQLREALATSLAITAAHLQYLGAIWQELERRGEDLSALRHGLTKYLPLIGAGRLDARIVINYAGKSKLIDALAGLPQRQQEHLLETNALPVARLRDDGSVETVEVALQDVKMEHLRQAFNGRGEMRSVSEQATLLQQRRRLPRERRTIARVVTVDAKRDCIVASNVLVPIPSIVAALREVYNDDELRVMLKLAP